MPGNKEDLYDDSKRSGEEKWSDWLQTSGTWVTSFILIFLTAQQMKGSNEDQQNRVMADYVKQMTVLRVEHGLSPIFLSKPTDDWKEVAKQEQVKLAARDNTLNAARQLDGKRKGQLLRYLYDTRLIGICPTDKRTSQLDIENCTDGFIELSGISLEKVSRNDIPQSLSLNGIDLQLAALENADLSDVVLMGADLSAAKLNGSTMTEAVLESAKLVAARLSNAKLQKAHMRGVTLRGADLSRANLSGADLRGADLRGVDFSSAQLQGANLEGAFYTDGQNKKTRIPENYKKVMRLCSDKIPYDSELTRLNSDCAPAATQTQAMQLKHDILD